MQEIKIKCPAKLNLSLDITGIRPDGYHELEMLMQTVDICDYLTVSVSNGSGIEISSDSSDVPCGESNTAYKAAKLFYEAIKKEKKVKIFIEKNIPQGAGMGGGSADAAGVLKALGEIENHPLSEEELLKIALETGADVPFCFKGGAALCCGIGELMTPVKPIKNVYAVILKPGVSVSTPWAYKAFDREKYPFHPKTKLLIGALEAFDYSAFEKFGGNSLENPVFREHKIIGELKNSLKELGAFYSLMTGSGSAVYGMFKEETSARTALKKLENKAEKSFLIKL